MEWLLGVISIVLLVLYLKERSKNKKMENDYRYINSRLLDITNDDESNYIPCHENDCGKNAEQFAGACSFRKQPIQYG